MIKKKKEELIYKENSALSCCLDKVTQEPSPSLSHDLSVILAFLKQISRTPLKEFSACWQGA